MQDHGMAISAYIRRMRESIGHDLLLLPAVTVLPRDEAGRFLLVRQSDTGRWTTIGGSVEVDEDPEVSAIREAEEEAGVAVELTRLVTALGGPQFRMTYPNGDEVSYLSLVYEARVVAGDPRPDHDETVEVGWFHPDELRDIDLGDFARHGFVTLGYIDAGDRTAEQAKRDLRRAYDASADVREAMADTGWKQRERERFLAVLRTSRAARVLEIGAGHGVSGRYFADHGLDVVCTDMSPELVQRCRAKGLSAHVMDFGELDFPEGSFDAVFGMNCLLHVPRADIDRVLRSVRSVLTPGGLGYWGQYSRDTPFEGVLERDDYVPKRFFSLLTDEEMQKAAGSVFDVVDFYRIAFDRPGQGYHVALLRK
jgi:8-oxo-dGTP pyrophosphatase MutT (NUDIX family)/SAM-dependent methyltransferase